MVTSNPRTRIKICGLTRVPDALVAARLGADAIGLVFYARSPRYVDVEKAAEIARALPPFVAKVGLFVNAERTEIERTLARVPLDYLQFHGDESPQDCEGFGKPFIKAVRVRPGADLIEYAVAFNAAAGLLLDAYVEGIPGGTGATFDWSLIPRDLKLPIVLSGGLEAGNVTAAVRQVRPWAVDVSSGVEVAKGIKDPVKIEDFIKGVRHADV
jgi:phosphoribosylanthranilate isomerase